MILSSLRLSPLSSSSLNLSVLSRSCSHPHQCLTSRGLIVSCCPPFSNLYLKFQARAQPQCIFSYFLFYRLEESSSTSFYPIDNSFTLDSALMPVPPPLSHCTCPPIVVFNPFHPSPATLVALHHMYSMELVVSL